MGRMKDLFGDVPYELPQPVPPKAFDGETYEPERDYIRLKGQMLRVWNIMQDGRWHTLKELAEFCDGSEAGVSARLRDLRKAKYGEYDIQREHIGNGLHRYRLVTESGDLI